MNFFNNSQNKYNNKKNKLLYSTITQIEKQFGKGSIIKYGEEKLYYDIKTVSTGSLGLDIELGIGGLPRGRIIEIYGPESSGKTTLALQIILEMQKKCGVCSFIDAEHALDIKYAKTIGVELKNLLISQPDTGEQALEITDALVRSGSIDLVVIDSVAALTPRAEISGEMGDILLGSHARLMSQGLRKLIANIKHTNCTLIFINQIRLKIGVLFGSPETTTGGHALKFYSSIRLDIRKIGIIKKYEEVIGNNIKVKITKNKLYSPFKNAYFDIIYGKGISKEGEIIEIGLKLGIIDKYGIWYSYKNDIIGKGKDNVKNFLKKNKNIKINIENTIKNIYSLNTF